MIIPMEPVLSQQIPFGDEWIHQIKWDGIRGLTHIDSNKIIMFTKNGNNHTFNYPEIQQLKYLFKGNNAVLDGEIVVFDETGKPSFSKIIVRDRIKMKTHLDYYLSHNPAKYIIFDILYLNGESLTKMDYLNRRKLLNQFLDKNSSITITDDFRDGEALLDLMKAQNLEGIVSKKTNSLYKEGKKHDDWFKIKLNKKLLAVVGGVSLKNNYPNALLIGIFRNNNLEFIGKVASGLKASDYQLIHNNLEVLKINECPFINMKKHEDYVWIKPNITCWIKFMDWTSSGGLRHPILIGFSNCRIDEANGKEVVMK